MPVPNMDADDLPPLITSDGLLARLMEHHGDDPRRCNENVMIDDRRQAPSRADLLAIMRAADIDNTREPA